MEAQRYQTNEWAEIKAYGTGFSGRARLKNLSSSGAYLELQDNTVFLEKGDLLRITVNLTDLGTNRKISAEVVWFKAPSGGTAGFGVCFIRPEQIYEKLSRRYS